MEFSKLYTEALIKRKGLVIEIRTREGGYAESNTVEANLLYEILQQLKNKKNV